MQSVNIMAEKNKFGGKGANLLKIKKSAFTPEFHLMGTEVFEKYLKKDKELFCRIKKNSSIKADSAYIEKKIMAWKLDCQDLKEILVFLKSKNIKEYIVRSSFIGENLPEKSHAGVFSSYVSKSGKSLEKNIKKVWASQFSERALAYRKLIDYKKTGMALIIQRFIKPDLSGVAVLNAKSGEFLAEFCPGGFSQNREKFIFMEKNGASYFDDFAADKSWGDYLRILKGRMAALSKIFPKKILSVEFVVSGGIIYIAQVSCARAFPFTDDILLKFENEENYNFHFSDFSDKRVNEIFGACALKSKVLSEISKKGLFIRYSFFRAIEEEISRAAKKKAFLENFHSLFLKFILSEAKKSKKAGLMKIERAFMNLKEINFKLAVFNYICARSVGASLDFIAEKHGRKNFLDIYASLMAPSRFYFKRFLKDVEAGKKSESFFADRIKDIPIDKLSKAFKNSEKQKITLGQISKSGRLFIEAVNDLILLKNEVNYYFSLINKAYMSRIFKLRADLTGEDIAKICKLSVDSARKIVNKEPGFRELFACKREKRRNRAEKIQTEFPLKGITVCAGDAKGRIKIVRNLSDAKDITERDILVSDYLNGELLVPMLICKAIITARGGFLSHAAALSREIKKPCLTGVFGCEKIFSDGEKITIRKGMIYRK